MIDTTLDRGRKDSTYTGNVRPAIGIVFVVIVIHVAITASVVNEINLAFWFVNILLFIMYMLFFAVMMFQATQFTLTIYEKGINWQRGSSHVFATWDKIDCIDRKNEGDSSTFGIYLKEPIQPEAISWLDKRLYSTPVEYIRLTPTVQVPTSFRGKQGNVLDKQAFKETDFGQDLLSYVPRLLENV